SITVGPALRLASPARRTRKLTVERPAPRAVETSCTVHPCAVDPPGSTALTQQRILPVPDRRIPLTFPSPSAAPWASGRDAHGRPHFSTSAAREERSPMPQHTASHAAARFSPARGTALTAPRPAPRPVERTLFGDTTPIPYR